MVLIYTYLTHRQGRHLPRAPDFSGAYKFQNVMKMALMITVREPRIEKMHFLAFKNSHKIAQNWTYRQIIFFSRK